MSIWKGREKGTKGWTSFGGGGECYQIKKDKTKKERRPKKKTGKKLEEKNAQV